MADSQGTLDTDPAINNKDSRDHLFFNSVDSWLDSTTMEHSHDAEDIESLSDNDMSGIGDSLTTVSLSMDSDMDFLVDPALYSDTSDDYSDLDESILTAPENIESNNIPPIIGSLSQEDATACLPNNEDHDWTSMTWIEAMWSEDSSLEKLIQCYFNTPRTTQQLNTFLEQVPPESGWIHTLLPQLNKYRNQTCNLVIMSCPKKHIMADFRVPLAEQSNFSLALVTGITDLIKRYSGIGAIGLGYRKQLRREPTDQHCARQTGRETKLDWLATIVELLIAKNVFNITFQRTLA